MPKDKEFELDDLESFSFDDLSLDDSPPVKEAAPGEDPLGVWVKSAPEDLEASAPPAEVEPSPAGELPEEDFLSTEELADLDDSFEFVTVEEPAETVLDDEVSFLDTPEAVEAERVAGEPSIPSFDEISLDDFVTADEVGVAEPAAKTQSPALSPAPEEVLEDDFGDEFLDIDIDIDDDIGDDKLEIVEGAVPKAEAPASELAVQDVDLAEFGDFEAVTPADSLGDTEDLPEVKDLPEIAALDEDPFLGEDEGYFEEEVFDENLEPLHDEGPVSLDLEPDDHTDMDHILALEEDLTSGIRPPAQASVPVPAPDDQSDRAAQILGKIEQELSSIKQEISDLKREVTQLRDLPREVAAPAAETLLPPSEPEEETPKSHGFFDEEDDETIALTGDELDNILSTAEISEGEEAGVDIDGDLLSLDTEGNLVEPAPAPTEAEVQAEPEVVHVTDEEFLAGTALADEESPAGVPESIELEESLPLELDEGETEDLLSATDLDFEVDPLPEGVLEGAPEAAELPTDEELGLDSAEGGTLAPDLVDEGAFNDELTLESLEPDLASEGDGWTPPPAEPLPSPPPVTQVSPAAAPASGGALSQGLKDELRAVLSYMDKLLASLPDDKIQEFAESEHFEVYKRLFEELGLIE